jgi:hypothetical protein
VREHKEGRKSLAAFAVAVAARVGPDEPVTATPRLENTDRMVLAYHLRRPLPRARLDCPRPGFQLAPVPAAGSGPPGLVTVLVSEKRGRKVALLRCGPATPR